MHPYEAAWARVGELLARSEALRQQARVIHTEAERQRSCLETLYRRSQQLEAIVQSYTEEHEPSS
jgi:hypothetical protein